MSSEGELKRFGTSVVTDIGCCTPRYRTIIICIPVETATHPKYLLSHVMHEQWSGCPPWGKFALEGTPSPPCCPDDQSTCLKGYCCYCCCGCPDRHTGPTAAGALPCRAASAIGHEGSGHAAGTGAPAVGDVGWSCCGEELMRREDAARG